MGILLNSAKNENVQKSISEEDLESLFIEFSNLVKIYRHFFHYVLDLKQFQDNNSNIYQGIKDSLIFRGVTLSNLYE